MNFSGNTLVKIIAAGLVPPCPTLLCCVVFIGPYDVDLDDEGRTSDRHGDGNDREIHTCKVEAPDLYMFPAEDVPPQETS
jgi:hypothetical protein